MTTEQWKSFGTAVWKYSAPLVLVFLVALQQGTPIKDALIVLYGAVIQLAINFTSKFVSETK